MLKQEEVVFYVRKAKEGDEFSKEILLKNNAPLLKSIIKKFCNKGVEYDDLYQLACIGFLKAIKNFDESFGVKFSTYTVPMVIGEIKRYMRDNGAIKVSRSLKILAVKVNKYIQNFKSIANESPTIEMLAKEFLVEPEDIVMALDSAKMPISLYEKDEESDGKSLELIDKITTDSKEDEMIDKIMLNGLIENLSERERKIILMRFYRDKTQSEIADSLGVSQVQISRLENKIIDKMRSKF